MSKMVCNVQDREQAIAKLVRSYRSYYNIHRFDGGESLVKELEGVTLNGKDDEAVLQEVKEHSYPLIARCDYFEHSEKYVLSRKAELWTANSEEFLYFFSVPHLDAATFEKCRAYALSDGQERANVGPGHMYSYITAIFLCDSIDAEATRLLEKSRFYKSFHFSLHGWLDYRNAVVELGGESIHSNYAGRTNAKILKKILFSKRGKEK